MKCVLWKPEDKFQSPIVGEAQIFSSVALGSRVSEMSKLAPIFIVCE